MQTPELIAEIRRVQDELCTSGVKREYIKFQRLSDDQLREILESVGEQLKRRKKWLGVN